jgi:hypothetical protein
MVDSCGHDSETSSTIKGEEFVNKLIDSHFFKENSAVGGYLYLVLSTAWGHTVACTMLPATRSRVQFSMRLFVFSIDLILPASLWPWGLLSL